MLVSHLTVHASNMRTFRDNDERKNAAGGAPAAQCGDSVLQIVCPYFVKPHTAADFGLAITQGLQALIAVLRSHLAGFRVIYDLDYGWYRSFIMQAQFPDGIGIAKDC